VQGEIDPDHRRHRETARALACCRCRSKDLFPLSGADPARSARSSEALMPLTVELLSHQQRVEFALRATARHSIRCFRLIS
jgi:hypothetical protein